MTVLSILTYAIAVLPLTGLVATAYLALVWSIRPRSIVLGLLALGATFAEAVALLVAPLAWRAVASVKQPPDAGFVIAVAIVVCIAIPHVYAVGVFVLRRRNRA